MQNVLTTTYLIDRQSSKQMTFWKRFRYEIYVLLLTISCFFGDVNTTIFSNTSVKLCDVWQFCRLAHTLFQNVAFLVIHTCIINGGMLITTYNFYFFFRVQPEELTCGHYFELNLEQCLSLHTLQQAIFRSILGKSTFFVVRTKTHRHDKNLSPESVLWSGGGDVGVEIEMLYTDALKCYGGSIWMD